MTPCQVEGCIDVAALKGMCRRHYHVEWSRTPKGRARQVRYRTTAKSKACLTRYETSKKGKETRDKSLYNLEPGDRERLRAFQNNTDPVSGQPLVPSANLDHCHKTGLIRGLLNPLSNRFLVDDLDKLRRMQAYIENPPAPQAFGEKVYGLIGKAKRKKVMKYGPDGSSTPKPRRVKGPVAL